MICAGGCVTNGSRYFKELFASLVIYAGVLTAAIWLLRVPSISAGWRPAIALAPMLPMAGCCWVILRQLRRMDEMQMRMQLEALGFSFAGTALLCMGYGFLEGVGYPRVTMFWVWPIMATLWIIGGFVARRRYQ